MSPHNALSSDLFWLYAITVCGILMAAGVVLFTLRWGLKKDIQSAWAAYKGWLIMAPLVLGIIFAGREAIAAGLMLLTLFAIKEFARATGLYRDWCMTGGVYLAVVTLGALSLVPDPSSGRPGWFELFMGMPVYATIFFVTIPIYPSPPMR